MRKTNSFTIETDDGKLDVEVYEVRPLDLLELHRKIQADKLPLGEYERLLPYCTNLTVEQLTKLYPSELHQVITEFRGVNEDFFAPWPTIKKIAEKVGLAEWITELIQTSGILETTKAAISEDWRNLFASSLSVATSTPSVTDGGTSPSASSSEKKPRRSSSKPPSGAVLQ